MSQTPRSSNVDVPHEDPDAGVIGTLKSLIVAFVLAMTFRGFVAEGFVIPTGSMAPTLLGEHFLFHSQVTGYTYPVSTGNGGQLVDPMLGPGYGVSAGVRSESVDAAGRPRSRMGDRILVLKGLYSFSDPKRWDVIVFKNPTEPKGEAGNYIKRLVGLPNETIWIADGDIFVREGDEGDFRIARKPEHVQRALWQPISHSDHMLVPQGHAHLGRAFHGPAWYGDEWDTNGRAFRTDSAGPTTLVWNDHERSIDDWTAYNMLMRNPPPPTPVDVSDLRVAAGVVADTVGLSTSLQLQARGHVFEYLIADGEARVRYRAAHETDWIDADAATVRLPRPGRVFNVEFWHVDQSMSIFLDGRRVAYLEYEWSALDRVEAATGLSGNSAVRAAFHDLVQQPQLEWRFDGSPVTLHHVRLDRDLHYRGQELRSPHQRNEPTLDGYGFGTHPENLAVLGPDHFYMLGDNSQASLDSRLWGSPHPLVASQIDDSPFIVHRKLLLGKAWVVYFPAPFSITDGGINLIPDFGRLRYIR